MLEINGKVYCMGDPHGEWEDAIVKIMDSEIKDCTLFILGDNGLGWLGKDSYKELTILQEVALENNINVYLIRGNHDNPSVWFEDEKRRKVHEQFPNLNVLNDQIISINGHHTLILGGGLSIDRYDRWPNTTWWSDEVIHVPELSEEELSKIDTILSHTCFFPDKRTTNSAVNIFAMYDNKLLDDLKIEQDQYRQLVENICKYNKDLKTLKIACGHFHINWYDKSFIFDNTIVEINCHGILSIKCLEHS